MFHGRKAIGIGGNENDPIHGIFCREIYNIQSGTHIDALLLENGLEVSGAVTSGIFRGLKPLNFSTPRRTVPNIWSAIVIQHPQEGLVGPYAGMGDLLDEIRAVCLPGLGRLNP
ncbi:MAG: hypothetical protein Q7R40_10275 [Phaeospirillum sp.]|nr:hypothetical protein [Phaeospirillum sp.]